MHQCDASIATAQAGWSASLLLSLGTVQHCTSMSPYDHLVPRSTTLTTRDRLSHPIITCEIMQVKDTRLAAGCSHYVQQLIQLLYCCFCCCFCCCCWHQPQAYAAAKLLLRISWHCGIWHRWLPLTASTATEQACN
jgi:hypothetical protein